METLDLDNLFFLLGFDFALHTLNVVVKVIVLPTTGSFYSCFILLADVLFTGFLYETNFQTLDAPHVSSSSFEEELESIL